MDQIALEIETLFHRPGDLHEGFLDQLLQPPSSLTTPNGEEFQGVGYTGVRYENVTDLEVVVWQGDVWRQGWNKTYSGNDVGPTPTTSPNDEEEDANALTVYGKDISDIPTQYTVRGLHQHELPVIGTYVDKRITTGFKYRVRPLDFISSFFNGQALTLEKLGMGYGKRLTFESEFKNENDNYFWSDSNPGGYGFSPVALEPGMKMEVFYGDKLHLGTTVIEEVDQRQTEVTTTISKNGAINKSVYVTFTAVIHFDRSPHGILPLRADEVFELSGMAIVCKPRGAKRAQTVKITEFVLPGYGPCAFHAEQGCE